MCHELIFRGSNFLRASRPISFLVVIFSLIFGVPSAEAHRLGVSTKVKKTEISVYVSYGRNSPCKGCRVKAKDSEKAEVFSGQTDAKGYAVFTPKSIKGGLTIVARDSMGHRGKRRISPARLEKLQLDRSDKEAGRAGDKTATVEKEAQASISVICKTSEVADTNKMLCKIDPKAIETMIKKEVENRLKPRHGHSHGHPHSHEPATSHETDKDSEDHAAPDHIHEDSFSIRDVIAGLGFIFGLAGFIIAVTKKNKS